jgi:hypothetical protein
MNSILRLQELETASAPYGAVDPDLAPNSGWSIFGWCAFGSTFC